MLKEDSIISTDAFEGWSANLDNIMDEVDVAPVESRMKELVKGLSFIDEDEETNNEVCEKFIDEYERNNPTNAKI